MVHKLKIWSVHNLHIVYKHGSMIGNFQRLLYPEESKHFLITDKEFEVLTIAMCVVYFFIHHEPTSTWADGQMYLQGVECNLQSALLWVGYRALVIIIVNAIKHRLLLSNALHPRPLPLVLLITNCISLQVSYYFATLWTEPIYTMVILSA